MQQSRRRHSRSDTNAALTSSRTVTGPNSALCFTRHCLATAAVVGEQQLLLRGAGDCVEVTVADCSLALGGEYYTWGAVATCLEITRSRPLAVVSNWGIMFVY